MKLHDYAKRLRIASDNLFLMMDVNTEGGSGLQTIFLDKKEDFISLVESCKGRVYVSESFVVFMPDWAEDARLFDFAIETSKFKYKVQDEIWETDEWLLQRKTS